MNNTNKDGESGERFPNSQVTSETVGSEPDEDHLINRLIQNATSAFKVLNREQQAKLLRGFNAEQREQDSPALKRRRNGDNVNSTPQFRGGSTRPLRTDLTPANNVTQSTGNRKIQAVQLLHNFPEEVSKIKSKCIDYIIEIKPATANIQEVILTKRHDILIFGKDERDFNVLRVKDNWENSMYGEVTPKIPDRQSIPQAAVIRGVPPDIEAEDIKAI